ETSLVAPSQAVAPPPLKETPPDDDTVLLPPPVPEAAPQETPDSEETSLVAPPPPPVIKNDNEETVVLTPEKEEPAVELVQATPPETGKKVLWPLFAILGLLLLILGGGIWYLLTDRTMSVFNDNRNTIVQGESFALPGDSDAIKDALERAKVTIVPDSALSGSDTTAVATQTSTPPPSAERKNAGKTATKPATPPTQQSAAANGKEVIAKVKMAQGQRLTLLSLKYYGNKVFWVYIYEYNKSKIGANPNMIPVGMEISVPAKSIYGIDAGSEASIRKAQQRQDAIISKLE
ncbi:MAG: hypothetical protein LBF85_07080, partial [Tannerella sp.]|nr:hypothetical protein [Tannerella sp.]